jgi:hypothetical protein
MRRSAAYLMCLLAGSSLGLTACDVLYPPTTTPDYTIRVTPTANGLAAIPPTCPDWTSNTTNPYDNQPLPQLGCANARNMALMVEKPEDLVQGRKLGDTRGTVMVGAMRRYDNNQTRGLVRPSAQPDDVVDITTSPASASAMTGDATGSSSSTSSSSSSSSGP